MDGPERSPHEIFNFELKRSFFEVSQAFVLVRMLSANQIAEKLQCALFQRIRKG